MSQKVALEALQHADDLRRRIGESPEILTSNTEIWTLQQQLQDAYQEVLLLDLELALDQKVEQELWNVAFKKFISALQSLARDKNNTQRNEAKTMLSWFLDAATGYYLGLMQQLCANLHLDLPFLRKLTVYGGLWSRKETSGVKVQRRSGLYMCQHCLVHLGDLARYRGHSRQAEAFYRHAIELAPNSGQPYNQLALLAASKGEHLATVFLYVRALAVRHPFTAAATNLEHTLKRCASVSLRDAGTSRLSGPELVTTVLKLHGVLRCHSDVAQAKQLASLVSHSFPALVATQAFSSWTLVQMLTLHIHLASEGSTAERSVMVDLIAACLTAYLLPAFTLSNHTALLSYCALPAVKLVLEWLLLRPEVILETGFAQRRQIWPALCQLLNSLQSALAADPSDPEHYAEVPLPEDVDLQGFLPLHKYLTHLRFEERSEGPDTSLLRASRIVQLGARLAETEEASKLLQQRDSSFELVQAEPVDILSELEALTLATDNNVTSLTSSSPVLSDAGSSSLGTGGKSTPDSSNSTQHSTEERPLAWQLVEEPEMWRMPGRMRQNVAMQAIFKSKAANNYLDVNTEDMHASFTTPSPNLASPADSYDAWKSPLELLPSKNVTPSPSQQGFEPKSSPVLSCSPTSIWNTPDSVFAVENIIKPPMSQVKSQVIQPPQGLNPTPQGLNPTSQIIQPPQGLNPTSQITMQPPSILHGLNPSVLPKSQVIQSTNFNTAVLPTSQIIHPASNFNPAVLPTSQPPSNFNPALRPASILQGLDPPVLPKAQPPSVLKTSPQGFQFNPHQPPPPLHLIQPPPLTQEKAGQQLWQEGNRTWEGLWGAESSAERDWSPAGLSAASSQFTPPRAQQKQSASYGSYSLFSPPVAPASVPASAPPQWPIVTDTSVPPPASQLQSLWTGPSPLQRLLEQQRQQRESGT